MRNCRWCHGALEPEPVFELSGIPQGAQALPTREQLLSDHPVNLHLYRCADCSLVQAVCEPVTYHREVIRANAVSPAMQSFRQHQLVHWVTSHRLQQAKVVEIGCGKGEFLGLLKDAGAKPVGIEYGCEAVQHAKSAGFEVWQHYLGDGPLPTAEKFPGWACFNFLEHWPDPRQVLRNLRLCLAPGAVGLVEVPNFEMVLRQRMLTELIPDHLFYFTPDTLRRCLEVSGFEVRSVEPIWHDYILSAQVQSRPSLPLPGFEEGLRELNRALQTFVELHAHMGVAIWGAGHQALTTLALSGVAKRVKYVVDSAPFKQGRFTPVTHLAIRDPNALTQDPVGAVVVMAAGYSDEVVSILRQSFDPTLKVAVLRPDHLELR